MSHDRWALLIVTAALFANLTYVAIHVDRLRQRIRTLESSTDELWRQFNKQRSRA